MRDGTKLVAHLSSIQPVKHGEEEKKPARPFSGDDLERAFRPTLGVDLSNDGRRNTRTPTTG